MHQYDLCHLCLAILLQAQIIHSVGGLPSLIVYGIPGEDVLAGWKIVIYERAHLLAAEVIDTQPGGTGFET